MPDETRQQRRRRERKEGQLGKYLASFARTIQAAGFTTEDFDALPWEQDPDDPDSVILKDKQGTPIAGLPKTWLNSTASEDDK